MQVIQSTESKVDYVFHLHRVHLQDCSLLCLNSLELIIWRSPSYPRSSSCYGEDLIILNFFLFTTDRRILCQIKNFNPSHRYPELHFIQPKFLEFAHNRLRFSCGKLNHFNQKLNSYCFNLFYHFYLLPSTFILRF